MIREKRKEQEQERINAKQRAVAPVAAVLNRNFVFISQRQRTKNGHDKEEQLPFGAPRCSEAVAPSKFFGAGGALDDIYRQWQCRERAFVRGLFDGDRERALVGRKALEMQRRCALQHRVQLERRAACAGSAADSACTGAWR